MSSIAESEIIEACIRDYLTRPQTHSDLLEIARRFHALPVYADMGGSFLLMPSREIHFAPDEPAIESLEPVRDKNWQLVALLSAAEKYSSLSFLLPIRPESEPNCTACEGSGKFPSTSIRCGECFGLGWKLAL